MYVLVCVYVYVYVLVCVYVCVYVLVCVYVYVYVYVCKYMYIFYLCLCLYRIIIRHQCVQRAHKCVS
jgi:hypothetical protein